MASSASQAFAERLPKRSWIGCPSACEAATPVRCSAAGFSALRLPAASRAMTPSELLARTSAQRRPSAPRGPPARLGWARGGTLEVVLAARVATGCLVGSVTRLELVHHLVEVLASVLAQLLAHLAHPACDALRVVLVEPGRVVAEAVHSVLLRAGHREARHEAAQIGASAAVAGRRDLLRDAEREHGDLLAAPRAPVLVDRHDRGIITPRATQASRQVRGWRTDLLGGLGREALLAVGEGGFLAVHHGVEHHVASPEATHVREGALGVLELEVAAVVRVREEQRAVAPVIGVLDPDDRHGTHAHALQQQLLDRPPAFLVRHVADHEVVAARFDADEVEVAHEPLAEPTQDERHVAVDLAGLEQQVAGGLARRNSLTLLGRGIVAAALDVLPHAQAEVVGIEAAGHRPDHLVVADQELEVQRLRQVEAVEDALVPERGPALVHDLGLDLRNEVLRVLVNDGEEVALPVGEERIVVADEEEDVLLGRRRRALEVDLDLLLALVDPLEGIRRADRSLHQAIALLTGRELAYGEVAAALQ